MDSHWPTHLDTAHMVEQLIHREFLRVVRYENVVSFGFQQLTPCNIFRVIAIMNELMLRPAQPLALGPDNVCQGRQD
jgi:hypothetical protein